MTDAEMFLEEVQRQHRRLAATPIPGSRIAGYLNRRIVMPLVIKYWIKWTDRNEEIHQAPFDTAEERDAKSADVRSDGGSVLDAWEHGLEQRPK